MQNRVIPCLQLIDGSLVKTVRFSDFHYIGDPLNTVRIFNELEVDELCFLDIRATNDGRQPDLQLLQDISNECFMPLSYGGGVRDFETAKQILRIGYEKIIVNTMAAEHPDFVTTLADTFGSQAVVASIDVKRTLLGKYQAYIGDGTINTRKEPAAWAEEMQRRGAGEILLTSMDRDGTWEGFNTDMIRAVTSTVDIPVIASGGGGSVSDIADAITNGGASAVALGSMLVYQAKGKGVLVNFPDTHELISAGILQPYNEQRMVKQ